MKLVLNIIKIHETVINIDAKFAGKKPQGSLRLV